VLHKVAAATSLGYWGALLADDFARAASTNEDTVDVQPPDFAVVRVHGDHGDGCDGCMVAMATGAWWSWREVHGGHGDGCMVVMATGAMWSWQSQWIW
jgi:hypothetical protein